MEEKGATDRLFNMKRQKKRKKRKIRDMMSFILVVSLQGYEI